MNTKWRTIGLLCIAEMLGMAVWFSESAVVASLAQAWSLDDSGRAWLTMSVQAGFVVGALISALLNLSDIVPAPRLMAVRATRPASASTACPCAARSTTSTTSDREAPRPTRAVWPGTSAPLFLHAYVNGPAPEATVENIAPSPGHFVRSTKASALMDELTVSVALLVTTPHTPLTSTE